MEARNRQFDSYCIYLEKEREPKERFYMPRRACLRRLGIPQAFQRLIDDELDLLTISLPPGTGKTTLEKFFHSAVVGWFPMDFSLFYSHSGDITRMYYDGMVDIISNSDEYTWNEIFPELHIEGQNAKLEQLNVGKYKPFPSVQCTSVGAKNAGKVRASRFLFVDDMIGSIEEALNKNTLEKLWNAYSVDARQRKVQSPYDGIFCKELHLATRWSTLDVIGRLQTSYEDSDRAEFIAIPDIDERTGKSNFEYAIGGYTAENFHDIEILMDDISYRCLYKQDPIEREGLLYQDDELRRYIDLPNREPDAIMGICDTKEKGIDYMFLPIFYKYDNDYYLVDCICDDNSDFGLQYKRLTDIIIRHNVQQVEFESNQGGSRIAFEIQKRLKEQGCRCNITTKPTETNKETRIIVNSDWIKQNCLFLNKTEYSPKSDYGKMMSFMLGYSVTGKNKHDDVPDGLANFALFVNRKLHYRPAQYTPGLF
jgi:predicted phage terminase large subunit-like protein